MKNYYHLEHPTRDFSRLVIKVLFARKYLTIPTGISLPVTYWDKRRKIAKVVNKFPEGAEINEKLDKLNQKVDKAIKKIKEQGIIPEKDYFKELIFNNTIEHKQNDSLVDYLKDYSNNVIKVHNTRKKYITTINKLIEYEKEKGKRICFDDVDILFYEDFKKWFYNLKKPIPKKRFFDSIDNDYNEMPKIERYNRNYFGTIIQAIKRGMRRSAEDGLHKNYKYQHSDFKVEQQPFDSIYLTDEELKRIYNAKIDEMHILEAFPKLTPTNLSRKIESYRLARNYFLIGAYTGLRISDIFRLKEHNFNDKFLTITTQKTNQPVIIPLHPIVKEIIKVHDFSKRYSEQKLNQQIKLVAKFVKIDAPIEITVNQGGKVIRKVYKKYQLISSHTARRSCATNMYIAKIPAQSIMKITGHKTESNFLKYLRITLQENAELLAKHDFFKS